jgi:MSHA biogenesis protein MshP
MSHNKRIHAGEKTSTGSTPTGINLSVILYKGEAAGRRSKQRGATTIVAVVISIIMLTIGIALSNQIASSTRQQSVEYYGTRAYLAAQTGLEVAVTRVVNGNNPECSSVATPILLTASALNNCSVSLACRVEQNIDEPEVASGAIRVYQLSSQAQCSAGQLETSRRLLVEVRQEE